MLYSIFEEDQEKDLIISLVVAIIYTKQLIEKMTLLHNFHFAHHPFVAVVVYVHHAVLIVVMKMMML